MKESKGVNVTKRSIKQDFRKLYGYERNVSLLGKKTVQHDRPQDMGCQVNSPHEVICTCKMAAIKHYQEGPYFNTMPKQIYTYHGVRSYSNIGVGSVKAMQRRKVKKIYLPDTEDRGVGSSDLSKFVVRRPNANYYGTKRTSSKCVGGYMEPADEIVSQKLSPIVRCCSATTGSEMIQHSQDRNANIEAGSNTDDKILTATSTQVEPGTSNINISVDPIKNAEPEKVKDTELPKEVSKEVSPRNKAYMARKEREEEKFSSDSFVQHVHNLEHPSEDKPSANVIVNKLEKEYRQMFTSKSKAKPSHDNTMQDQKNASLLRRRFEALRRGILKDDSKKSIDDNPTSSSAVSAAGHKNVSIVSDPPSLEARSFTKPSPPRISPKYDRASYKPSVTGKKDSFQSIEDEEIDYQGVSGMFRLWGKRFNFEEDRVVTMKVSSDISEAKENKKGTRKNITEEPRKKTDGKKFFFFKRRSRDKTKPEKPPYKNKKGVTTNRCEVKDGLVVKIGGKTNNYTPNTSSETETSETYREILRKAWLKSFLNNTIDSRDSVKVRWNNRTYTTSSSTVFELVDNIYKHTGIVVKSKSNISMRKKSKKPPGKRVNFIHQNIEAWMMPKTIMDRPIVIPINSTADNGDTENIELRVSDSKWAIDLAKAFPHKIELVLHANSIVQNVSSDFLRIDIPRGFFSSDSASNDDEEELRGQTSDEKVYNIVEYETMKSNSEVKKNANFNMGDRASNEIKITVNVKGSKDNEAKVLDTVIKNPPSHRDVVIQGSNVFFPKRCDVIGVGIITQRDIRELKPILKLHDELSEEESETTNFCPKKKCEFAESYLQDYYRHWMPLGIDHLSWCFSDCNVKCGSEKNSLLTVQQGDASKSCPNIYEDSRTSEIVSSSEISSCSHYCAPYDDDMNNSIFFGKIKKNKTNEEKKKDDRCVPDENMRVLPKDSIEVFRKRKIYACSNKSKWGSFPTAGPRSEPSWDGSRAPDTFHDSSNKKSCCKHAGPKHKKSFVKHVSLPDCETMCEGLADTGLQGILSFGKPGCELCRKSETKCPKHAKIQPEPCEINLDPVCKPDRDEMGMPECEKLDPKKSKDKTKKCPDVECDKGGQSELSEETDGTGCDTSPLISALSGTSGDSCDKSIHVQSKQVPPAPPPSIDKKACRPPSPAKPSNPPPQHCPPSPTGSTPAQSCPKQKTRRCPLSPPPPTPTPAPPAKKTNPKKPVVCDTPPCRKPTSAPLSGTSPSPPCSGETYPWPTKNQNSSPPSPEYSKINCPERDKRGEPPKKPTEPLNKCKENCSFKPTAQGNDCTNCCNKKTLDTGVDAFCPPQMDSHTDSSCANVPSDSLLPPHPPQIPSPNYPRTLPPCPPPNKYCAPLGDSVSRLPCPYFPDPNLPTPESCSLHPMPPPCLKAQHPATKPMCPTPMQVPQPTVLPPQPTLLPPQPPPPPPPPCPASNPSECECPNLCKNMKSKIAGLFLRKNPSKKKTCADDCSSWTDSKSAQCEGEHLNIRIKQCSPSTEEIREVRLRDEDGQTICERREYLQERTVHRHSALGDVYKSSNVCQRLSANSMHRNVKVNYDNAHAPPQKSEISLANLVEIQFRLKITQGDKETEINLGDDGDSDKEKATKEAKTCRNVFTVNNPTVSLDQGSVSNPKNDINIHIVIKNFKQKDDKKEKTECSEKCIINHVIDDDFSKKISDKFQTVSTGYSQIWHSDADRNEGTNKNLSVDRESTKDLTVSEEKSRTQSKPSGELSDFTDKEHATFNASKSVINFTESIAKQDTTVDEKVSDIEKDVKTTSDVDRPDDEDTNADTEGTGQEGIDEQELPNRSEEGLTTENPKSSIKEEKKRQFKMVLEKAGKMKNKNKAKVSELTAMLKNILTSDSSHEEIAVASNELVKDITYSALNPAVIRDSASMNNFFKISSMTSGSEYRDLEEQDLSKEESDSNNSDQESDKGCSGGCMCSTLATKLNLPKQIGGCCCRGPVKVSIETNCDIRTDEDVFLFNYGSSLVDKETQRSRLMVSKGNSAKFSSHNHESVKEDVPSHSLIDTESRSRKDPEEKVIRKNQRKKHKETKANMRERDKIIANMEPAKYKIETMYTDVTRNKEWRGKVKSESQEIAAPADVLQSYEIKKAVLEIYTEKTFTNGKEHLVAKLPKFVYGKESEIRKYGEVTVGSVKQFCSGSVVMSLDR